VLVKAFITRHHNYCSARG